MESDLLLGWPLLFLIAAAQGLFFGSVLIARHTPNRYLGAMLLSFSLMMLYYVAFWTRLHLQLPRSLAMLQGCTYLLGIWLYFYMRSSPAKLYFNWRHLLPLPVYMSIFIAMGISTPEITRSLILVQVMLQIAHLLIYAFLSWQLSQSNKNVNSAWNRKIVLAFSGYALTFIAYYLMVWTGILKIEYDYMVSAASTFFIYLVGYYGFKKPDVLRLSELERYANSSIDEHSGMMILAEIRSLLDTDQHYLNADLRLSHLAELTGYNTNQISQSLNAYAGHSFNDFINSYRIDHAIRLMDNEPDETLINIAYSSGFNNKNSFANAFKKVTGSTPSAYRKNMETAHP